MEGKRTKVVNRQLQMLRLFCVKNKNRLHPVQLDTIGLKRLNCGLWRFHGFYLQIYIEVSTSCLSADPGVLKARGPGHCTLGIRTVGHSISEVTQNVLLHWCRVSDMLHVRILIGGSNGCATIFVPARLGLFPFWAKRANFGKHSWRSLIEQLCLRS